MGDVKSGFGKWLLPVAFLLTAGCATVKIPPPDALGYTGRGIAYVKKGEYDQAISDLTKALEIYPRYAEAYINRGVIYERKSQYDQAISDFTKALEINPRDALAYSNRAIAYYHLKDYDKAWEDVFKAQGLGYQIHPVFLDDLRRASGTKR